MADVFTIVKYYKGVHVLCSQCECLERENVLWMLLAIKHEDFISIMYMSSSITLG